MTSTVPTRHPDHPRAVPQMVRLSALLLGIRRPTPGEWDRLGASLLVGDGPMDDLLAWMRSAGMAQAREQFDLALREGVAAVADAPRPLRDFFAQVEAAPSWVDHDKIRRGQRALRAAGLDGAYLARDVSLMGGYQFAGFNKTLLRTGALEKGSNQRVLETLQWALDVISDGGLQPGGVGYQSTLRVRLIHAFVRQHVSAMRDWQQQDWGLPINQTDMAATLFGVFIAPTAAGMAMGLLTSPADLDAIAHHTRYVGWLMGVEDCWLPTTFREGVRGLHHALMALSAPDETTPRLAMPMAEDPLSWNFDRFPALRRRLARAQHLSLATAYLGPRTMRTLGLSPALPWYPLVRAPINGVRSLTALTLPGGKDRAADRGWRAQHSLMRTISTKPAVIGASAAGLGPAA